MKFFYHIICGMALLFLCLCPAEAKEALKTTAPVASGYYYFVNSFPNYLKYQKVEKAMYGGTDAMLHWTTFKEGDVNFIFKVDTLADGHYNIQCVGTQKYINTISGTSSRIPMTETPEAEQIITSLGSGQYNIANVQNTQAYHTEGHQSGYGTSGYIVTWDGGINSASAWAIRPITHTPHLDSLIMQQEQISLTKALSPLIQSGLAVFDSAFVYYPSVSSASLVTSASQLSTNAPEPTEGALSYLIDNKYATYFLSSKTVTGPAESHYVQVNLSQTPLRRFSFFMRRRLNNSSNWPTQIIVQASNDTLDASSWLSLDTLSNIPSASTVTTYTSPIIDLGLYYKYVRFRVTATSTGETNQGYPYFALAEMRWNENAYNPEGSSYVYLDGMKARCDTLSSVLYACMRHQQTGTLTSALISRLRAATDSVRFWFPDTASMTALIAQARFYLRTTLIGTGVGNVGSMNDKQLLYNAINKAASVSLAHITKEALASAVKDLQGSLDLFLSSVRTLETGKWYYIKTTSQQSPYAGTAMGVSSGTEQKGRLIFGGNESSKVDDCQDPRFMWRFVPMAGGCYAVQNMAAGYFLSDFTDTYAYVSQSDTAVAYHINFKGNAAFEICPVHASSCSPSPYLFGSLPRIVSVESTSDNGAFWTFTEVTTQRICVPFSLNELRVVCLPYRVDSVTSESTRVRLFRLSGKVMEGDSTAALILKEIHSAEPGCPFLLETGDCHLYKSNDNTTVNLWMNLPSADTLAVRPSTNNGLIGTLPATLVSDTTCLYVIGYHLSPFTTLAKVKANSGYIQPASVEASAMPHDGTYTYYLTRLGQVVSSIRPVRSVTSASVPLTVYRPDGTAVLRHVTREEALRLLPKGLYIIGGEKVRIR